MLKAPMRAAWKILGRRMKHLLDTSFSGIIAGFKHSRPKVLSVRALAFLTVFTIGILQDAKAQCHEINDRQTQNIEHMLTGMRNLGERYKDARGDHDVSIYDVQHMGDSLYNELLPETLKKVEEAIAINLAKGDRKAAKQIMYGFITKLDKIPRQEGSNIHDLAENLNKYLTDQFRNTTGYEAKTGDGCSAITDGDDKKADSIVADLLKEIEDDQERHMRYFWQDRSQQLYKAQEHWVRRNLPIRNNNDISEERHKSMMNTIDRYLRVLDRLKSIADMQDKAGVDKNTIRNRIGGILRAAVNVFIQEAMKYAASYQYEQAEELLVKLDPFYEFFEREINAGWERYHDLQESDYYDLLRKDADKAYEHYVKYMQGKDARYIRLLLEWADDVDSKAISDIKLLIMNGEHVEGSYDEAVAQTRKWVQRFITQKSKGLAEEFASKILTFANIEAQGRPGEDKQPTQAQEDFIEELRKILFEDVRGVPMPD